MKVKEIGAKVKKAAAAVLLAAMLHNAPLLAETPPNCIPFKKIEIDKENKEKYKKLVSDNKREILIDFREDFLKIQEEVVYAEADKEKNCYTIITKNKVYETCIKEKKNDDEPIITDIVELIKQKETERNNKIRGIKGKESKTFLWGNQIVRIGGVTTSMSIDYPFEGEAVLVFTNENKDGRRVVVVLTDKKMLYAFFITENDNKKRVANNLEPPYKVIGGYKQLSSDTNLEKIGVCTEGNKYYYYDEEKMKMVKLNVSDK